MSAGLKKVNPDLFNERGKLGLQKAMEAAEGDISSAGVWPLLSNLEDPELHRLAAGLPQSF